VPPRKFVYARETLNVGSEIASPDDEYDHEQLLRQLGVYELGVPGHGFGEIDGDVARIDVDADGLERALRDAGYRVERAQLLRWDDGDEPFDAPGDGWDEG
jgi:hypothetical protein